MRKEYDALKVGDVIWANPLEIGQHIFIICDLNEDKSIDCYPSINLSSNCSKCEDCCINIKGVDMPKDWFRITNDVSYLRIDNPMCLMKESYRNTHYSYKGNLKKNYSDLFDMICEYNASITREVCGCKTQ